MNKRNCDHFSNIEEQLVTNSVTINQILSKPFPFLYV
uniref:Uncharacterized protein n=1 Tax=Anguilla anguilla TaxID=7936 RepID=A0A0E9W6N1_ANGAN